MPVTFPHPFVIPLFVGAGAYFMSVFIQRVDSIFVVATKLTLHFLSGASVSFCGSSF